MKGILITGLAMALLIVSAQADDSVVLTVKAPFSEAEVTVASDGLIAYKELFRRDGRRTESTNTIAAAKDVADFFKAVADAKVDTWNASYKNPEIADITTYVLSVTIRDKQKSVTVEGHAGPAAFYQLKDKIEKLLRRRILAVGV